MHINIPALWKQYRRIVFVLVFVALLILALQWTGLRQNFSLAYLRQTLAGSRWEGLTLFVVLFAVGNLVQVPGWIFLASAVLVLGKLDGGLVTYLAASISCAVTFLSVRWVGGDAVQHMDGPLARRLLSRLHAHPVRNVMVLRTLFQTLAVLNYTLALSGMGFRKYMVATLLGLPLPIAVYCLLFDSIAKFAKLG